MQNIVCDWRWRSTEGLIAAILAVRDIEMLHISSRTRTKAEKLAEFVKQTYHVSTKVFDSGSAMENADIVATATNSNKTGIFSFITSRCSFKCSGFI